MPRCPQGIHHTLAFTCIFDTQKVMRCTHTRWPFLFCTIRKRNIEINTEYIQIYVSSTFHRYQRGSIYIPNTNVITGNKSKQDRFSSFAKTIRNSVVEMCQKCLLNGSELHTNKLSWVSPLFLIIFNLYNLAQRYRCFLLISTGYTWALPKQLIATM